MGYYNVSLQKGEMLPITWYKISDKYLTVYIGCLKYNGVISENEIMTGNITVNTGASDVIILPENATATQSPIPLFASDTLNYFHLPDDSIFGNAPASMNSWVRENGLILKNYMNSATRMRGIGAQYLNELNNNFNYIFDLCMWLVDTKGNLFRTQMAFIVGYGGISSNAIVDKYPNAKELGSISFNLTTETYDHNTKSWLYTWVGNDYGTTPGDTGIYISSESDFYKKNIEIYIENENPYDSNPNEPGTGGTGNRKDWDGTTPIYDVPTANILDLGVCSVYTPTETQLNNFAEFLWSDAFSLDSLKKILADPMEAIISLHMLPFSVTHGLESQITIGNVGSGVNADILGAQFYKKDMGTLAIDEYYGNFFDYSPYTKYSIFLPYIGYKDFIPDDFVGGSMSVYYYIDAITGKCTAILYSSKYNAILYQYEGNLLYQVPITSGSYANAITGVASAAISAAGSIIRGGKSAITSVLGAAVSGVSASKPDIQRSGGIGGASGWLGYQQPFLIRIRPNGIIAKNQQSYTGFPTYQAYKLSNLSGYTVVHDINLSLNGATQSEYEETESLLKSGVII